MKELDIVLLKDGRRATILEDYGPDIMIEISDEKGRALDLPTISKSDVEKVIKEY